MTIELTFIFFFFCAVDRLLKEREPTSETKWLPRGSLLSHKRVLVFDTFKENFFLSSEDVPGGNFERQVLQEAILYVEGC